MRTTISCDREIAIKLRDFAERKHGFVLGAMKRETELAILNHIKAGGGNG